MLISCPECGKQISDKAIFCPSCGFPMQKTNITPQRVRKFKKLPNGYGQIKHLSGRRRKPYAAYPPVAEYDDNGSPVQRAALGYFPTYQQAMECLTAYNADKYDVELRRLTFAQTYELFFENKFSDKSKTYSNSSIYSTKAAFLHLKPLHNKRINSLRAEDIQRVIDESPCKHATLETMVSLTKSVFKFALERDIIKKDYSQFVKIKREDDTEKGVPFGENELAVLWDNSDIQAVQIMLIMIYSGLRISELETLKFDFENQYMQGGVKTKSSKNRIIPIHPAIMDFVVALSKKRFHADSYRKHSFYPTLKQIGLETANTGAKHTPHDCRHTFSWLADKYNVDDLSKHLIMGHTLAGKDIEMSVYGHRTTVELLTEIKKIQANHG